MRHQRAGGTAAVLTAATLVCTAGAWADEAQARELFKAMSDYLAAQTALSFDVESSLDVVTKDDQLALASSGSVAIERPDKFHATRTGGFAAIEAGFDGKTLTLLKKDENVYAEAEVPGTIEGGDAVGVVEAGAAGPGGCPRLLRAPGDCFQRHCHRNCGAAALFRPSVISSTSSRPKGDRPPACRSWRRAARWPW